MVQRGGEALVFEVAGQCFGLPAASVRELTRAVAIVPVPLAGPTVEGVVNLRGRVVPVVDLRARLGLPGRAVVPSDHMIVVDFEGLVAALRVDRALGLVRLDGAPEDAAPGAETERSTGEEGARVVRLADGLATLLDPRALFEGVNAPETIGVAPESEAETGGEAS